MNTLASILLLTAAMASGEAHAEFIYRPRLSMPITVQVADSQFRSHLLTQIKSMGAHFSLDIESLAQYIQSKHYCT